MKKAYGVRMQAFLFNYVMMSLSIVIRKRRRQNEANRHICRKTIPS